MNRQAAFEGTGARQKGALHVHTTRSDGKGTPEEVIRLYAERGFSFVALTDHRKYNYRDFSGGAGPLIVPGVEIDRYFPPEDGRCYHAVAIGPAAENGNGFAQDQPLVFDRVSGQEDFQQTLDEMHRNGNLTIYCHPEWSGTPARDFERLTGNFAMEIWNSGCALEVDMDTNAAYWDELLSRGIRIFGAATDDGHAMHQHARGWVVVNAEKDLDSILGALGRGAFYSSCGPKIHDFYVEDGKAILECSPCERILFHAPRCPNRSVHGEGAPFTRGECELMDRFDYVRASVIDGEGRRAWTNPIFLK